MKTWVAILGLLFVGFARADESEIPFVSLYQYKPIYFLMGNPYTKIQLSISTQLLRTFPLYFGYTQLMMWDLFVSQPYFYDINYNPEIFYRLQPWGRIDEWIDLDLFDHESNGRGAGEERSWNRFGIRYHTRIFLGENTKLYGEIKAWVPWAVNSHNEKIERRRGSWELTLTLTDFLDSPFQSSDFILRIYPGGVSTTNPIYGGQELTFRWRTPFKAILPSFVAQVFHGYGEYLLALDDDHWGLRAGFGF